MQSDKSDYVIVNNGYQVTDHVATESSVGKAVDNWIVYFSSAKLLNSSENLFY